jgi:hypothetical protein
VSQEENQRLHFFFLFSGPIDSKLSFGIAEDLPGILRTKQPVTYRGQASSLRPKTLAPAAKPVSQLRAASQAVDKASARALADEKGATGRATNFVPLPDRGAPASR